MANKSITQQYVDLPWIVKVILQLVFGLLISGIYRIIRFLETKNLITLIAGIVGLFTGIGNAIFWILDLVTTILAGKPTVFAD